MTTIYLTSLIRFLPLIHWLIDLFIRSILLLPLPHCTSSHPHFQSCPSPSLYCDHLASVGEHIAHAKDKMPILLNTQKRIGKEEASRAASSAATLVDSASAEKQQQGVLANTVSKLSPRSRASPRDGNKVAMAKNLINDLRNNLTSLQDKISILQAEQDQLQAQGHSAEGIKEKKALQVTMMEDIERMTEAIQLSNTDMVQVQEENTKYRDLFNKAKEKVDAFDNELSEGTKFVEEVIEYRRFVDHDPENIPDPLTFCKRFDEHSLLLIITQMGHKLKEIEDERLEAKRYLFDAKAAKQQYERLKVGNKELKDAHLLQNKFIRKLERKNKEYLVCKEQIHNQEVMIKNMQEIIAERIKPDEQPHFIEYQEGRANPMVAAEIYKLNDVLSKEREVVSEKESKLAMEREAVEELKSQAFDLEGSLGDPESVDRLKEETQEKIKVNNSEIVSLKKRKADL